MSTDAPEPHGSNTLPNPLIEKAMSDWWKHEADKNSLKQSHRKQVGDLTKQQNEIYDSLREGGVNVRAFKELIALRKDDLRVASRQEKLDDEDKEAVDKLRAALGDFANSPLGQAALGGDDEQWNAAAPPKATAAKARKARQKQQADELDNMGATPPEGATIN